MLIALSIEIDIRGLCDREFKHQFAVILTTCYYHDVRHWWQDETAPPPEWTKGTGGWEEMHELLKKSISRWSIPLRSSIPHDNETPSICYGLYAIYDRQGESFKPLNKE